VFENRVLRRTFRPERDKVTGEWRRLHDEELYGVFSININPVIKYGRDMWHVWETGEGHTGV
jgi:hypothetical protein